MSEPIGFVSEDCRDLLEVRHPGQGGIYATEDVLHCVPVYTWAQVQAIATAAREEEREAVIEAMYDLQRRLRADAEKQRVAINHDRYEALLRQENGISKAITIIRSRSAAGEQKETHK